MSKTKITVLFRYILCIQSLTALIPKMGLRKNRVKVLAIEVVSNHEARPTFFAMSRCQ